MKPPQDAPRSAKFHRQYDRTRGLFEAFEPAEAKSILNTLFSVYPIAFERAENQARIRDAYRDLATPLSLFDLNLMRLFRRSSATKAAICCMPKSGSTFLLNALGKLGAPKLETAYLHTPYANADFVDALSREHEIDELALLILEIRRINWVAHMHTKWTPYTEKVFRSYGVRPIVTYRNIFDCIVSMDDMLMKKQVNGFSMIRLPKGYFAMVEADRLSFLTLYVGPWYIDYIVSWSRCAMPVLHLNYDRDILGFGEETALALRDHLGLKTDLATFLEAFEMDEESREKARFNKGVSGRGDAIPATARQALSKLADVYRDETDFTGLV